jgi:hypothetical protein
MDYTTNYTTSAGDVFIASLQNVMANFLLFLPKLLSALVILVIGIILAVIVAGIVRRLVELTRIDRAVERLGTHSDLKRTGIHFTLSGALAWIVKWLIILATIIAVAGILNLEQLNVFLNQILLFIPNIFVAVVILTVGFILGDFLERFIRGATGLANLPAGNRELLGLIAKYAAIVFSVTAALIQLHIATSLIQMLFGGLVLALALAFGLGGREHASRLLDRVAPR